MHETRGQDGSDTVLQKVELPDGQIVTIEARALGGHERQVAAKLPSFQDVALTITSLTSFLDKDQE